MFLFTIYKMTELYIIIESIYVNDYVATLALHYSKADKTIKHQNENYM